METVKKTTQTAVENVLQELQDIRAEDPFRQLNPLAWRDAVQPESAMS